MKDMDNSGRIPSAFKHYIFILQDKVLSLFAENEHEARIKFFETHDEYSPDHIIDVIHGGKHIKSA